MSNFRSTLYSYDHFLTDGLFKNLVVPEEIDKDTLIAVIMMECGEMCPIWTDAEFMQEMIGVWSTKWYDTFERWVRALSIEYDPLNNYDRTETWTNSNSAVGTNSSTATTDVSAYDSTTLTTHDRLTISGSDGIQGSETKSGRTYGNIGVTTSQKMLLEELDVAEWNIYNHIKDLFMQDFMIMIY